MAPTALTEVVLFADARGAYLDSIPPDAIATNLVRFDGHISGLELDAGSVLVVRDYDGNANNNSVYPYTPIRPIPITIDQHLAMAPGGTLRMVFEADALDSTISFSPGIPVTLGGTLELTFAADVNLASQVGRTFHLFDWTGVDPTGTFAISSGTLGTSQTSIPPAKSRFSPSPSRRLSRCSCSPLPGSPILAAGHRSKIVAENARLFDYARSCHSALDL